jgi:hypothetical protein
MKPSKKPRTDRADRTGREVGHESNIETQPLWRRSAKWGFGVLVAFGIFGAAGTQVVGELFPAAREKLIREQPLRISLREAHNGSNGFWMAARSLAAIETQLRKARDCTSLFELAKRAGAADIGESTHDLLLEGRTYRDVTIVAMRAVVLKREPALSDAKISCASSGAQEAIGVVFNLDEPHPVARRIRSRAYVITPGKPYFGRGNVISLKPGEIQPFQIVAQATKAYVEWELHLDTIIDGKARKVTIDNNGEPFRVTARHGTRGYQHYVEWAWYENPQRLYVGDTSHVDEVSGR